MLKLPKDKIIKFKIYDIPIPIPFKLLVIYKITLPISSYYGFKPFSKTPFKFQCVLYPGESIVNCHAKQSCSCNPLEN